MLQKQVFKLDLKDVAEDGTFKGHIAVFNNVDLGNDRIVKGAFKDSIKAMDADLMPVLWQHKWDEPIGVYTKLEEEDYGLYAEGKLVLGVRRADEAHKLMLARAVKGLSIGYMTKKSSRDGDVRVLEKLDLMEASIVTFPMNPKARVTAVKSLRDFEEMLTRDAGFTRSEALAIINDGYKSMLTKRDAGESDLAEAIRRNINILKG